MKSTITEILDTVQRGKNEVTFDIASPELREEIKTLAVSRGFHVSGYGRWLLVRDLSSDERA